MKLSEKKRINKVVGNNIKRMRLTASLTQEQLAKKLGVNRVTVVNTERGLQSVTIHTLIALQMIFGCSFSDIAPMKAEVTDKLKDMAQKKAERKELNDKERNLKKALIEVQNKKRILLTN